MNGREGARNGAGTALYIIAVTATATEFVLAHLLGPRFDALQIALIHCIGQILLLIAIMTIKGVYILRSGDIGKQLIRSGLGTARFWALVALFAYLPLADATALSYTQSSFVILFSVLLLGERPGLYRWLGVLLGFAGTLLITQPGFTNLRPVYLLGIGAPALSALATVTTKWTYRADPVDTTFGWIAITSLALTIAGNLLLSSLSVHGHMDQWPTLDRSTAIAIVAIAVLGSAGTYLLLWALRMANVSALAPYGYTRLVLNGAAALIIFQEMPGTLSWVGIVIIVASSLGSSFLSKNAKGAGKPRASMAA